MCCVFQKSDYYNYFCDRGDCVIMEQPEDVRSDVSSPIPPGQSRHLCVACAARMSKIEVDPHTKCSSCRGINCDVENRCAECADWSVDFVIKCLNYHKVLQRKRDGKRKAKERNVDPLLASIVAEKGVIGSEMGDSESEVVSTSDYKEYVDCKFEDFSKGMEIKFQNLGMQLSTHIKGEFSNIMSEMSNRSFSAPSKSAVTCSQDKRATDKSTVNPPLSDVGLGVQREEQRLRSMSKSPHVLQTPLIHGVPGRGRGRGREPIASYRLAGSHVAPTPSVGKGRGYITLGMTGELGTGGIGTTGRSVPRQVRREAPVPPHRSVNSDSYEFVQGHHPGDVAYDEEVYDDDYYEEVVDPDDPYCFDEDQEEEEEEEFHDVPAPDEQVDPEEDIVPEVELDPDSIQSVSYTHLTLPTKA